MGILSEGKKRFKQSEIGPIPEDWELKTLKEICLQEKGAVISGPFGSNIGSRFFVEEGIPVIRGNNLTTDFTKFVDNGFVFITEEKANELHTWAEQEDLVFTAAGTLGQVAIIPSERKFEKYIISNKQLRARLDKKKVVPLFAFYWFQSEKMIKFINVRNTGSTIPLINLGVLKSLPLPFPQINEQKAIVELLSVVDSKIELNQQMNRVLEAVGAAVFKHWFVDFEFPNQEGKPYKSSDGEMVSNEKFGKEIPKDWHVVNMTEVALIVDCLHSKKPNRTKTGPLLLQVFNIDKTGYLDLSDPFNVSEEDYKYWTRNIEVRGGDCIITNAGRVGAIAQIPEGFHFGIGRNITAIRPNKISPSYLINYLQSEYGTNEIQKNVDSGTILDSLNVKGIIKIKIVMPLQTILDQYENLARPLRKRIEINNNQTFTLSQIRDRLIPQLMSGKIRVPIESKMEIK